MSETWARAVGPDEEVLLEGPVTDGELGTEWKELIGKRFAVRPIQIYIRRDGRWTHLLDLH